MLNNKYDDAIQSAVKRDWPDFPDWKYWKAQLYQESRFDPNARSPSGAIGLAQFMPATFADITHQLGWSGISANQADQAIEAGAYYMARLRHTWSGRSRPILEQHYLGMSAYNAGTGNILKAQVLCNNSTLWSQISPCLKFVTGTLSQQTVDYVSRIVEWRRELGQ